MRFSTVLTVLATGAMAFAGTIPKRSDTDLQAVFNNLGTQCDTLLPKLDACSDDDCTNQVVLQMVDAVNDCKNKIGPLPGGTGDSDDANVVANIVTVSYDQVVGPESTHIPFQKIENGLESHKNKCGTGCPKILTTYAQLDSPLSDCLNACFKMYTGLSSLVPPL